MKAVIVSIFGSLAFALLSGCGDYYYESRGPAYGGGVAYADPNAPVGTDPVGTDPTFATAADVQPMQDVAIGVDQTQDEYVDTDPSALTDFHSTLDPYGSWVEDPSYGTVWVPSNTVVGSDFSPYVTAGHWAYGDDYVWVSDYEWGWAPFHYGRWAYLDNRGWGWIPGRRYAGAWVNWRTGYDGWGYVGWAPTPPNWYWRNGMAVGLGIVPRTPYTFCATGDLFAPGLAGRAVAGQQVAVVASHTRPFVAASPSVGTAGRVAASPGIGAVRNGPPPSQLGLGSSQIQRAPTQDRGMLRAQQFAHPGSATSLGARPPVGYARNAGNTGSTYRPSTTVATSPSYSRSPGTPQYRSAPVPSYSQSYRASPTFQPHSNYSSAPARSYSTPSYSSGARPSYSPSYSAPHSSSPSYSAPHSSPSYPSHSSGGGSFHGSSGGGHHR